MRGVRKNRYREATRTLQSGVPDNLRGCWSGLYPYASRSKYQSIPICATKSDPLDLRRPGVWGRGEAVERQYGHALSSHALHSRPRCRHGLPRWSCARPPRSHLAPGFLRRRKQDSMVGSVLDAHSGFRGKCALVFAAMVSVVLSSG